jgi:DNA replication and repair protein RecF
MLKTLELINFRSYKNGLFEFSDGVNIIVGANASGKTNLLEAIHTLCCGKAFKSDDAELVRKDEQWARINASLETHSRSVKIKLVPQEKIFVIDDNEHRRLGVQQIIPFVLFEPENMLLLSGEPERRRVYLDELIAKIDKGYKTLVNNYKRILLQRNRLLKQDSISEDHLFAWDLQMSEIAGKIIERRLEFISRLNGRLPDAYQHVSGNVEESLRIEYL